MVDLTELTTEERGRLAELEEEVADSKKGLEYDEQNLLLAKNWVVKSQIKFAKDIINLNNFKKELGL